jgi:hypothetical protein
MITQHLTFSDSAKFAQSATSLVKGQGLQISHSFFNPELITSFSSGTWFPANFLPLPSWILSFIFRFFPATDTTIAFTGLLFFILSTLLIFSIGKKLHSVKAGLISALLFISSMFFQEYALNFASEIVFIPLILLFIYLMLLPKKLKLMSLIPLLLMFITRQQASVFLGSFLLAFLAIFITGKANKKKKGLVLLALALSGLLFVIISNFTANSIFSPAKVSISFNIAAGSNFGSYIRGGEYQVLSLPGLASKIFYNFYNFVKAPERLAFPPIFLLFIYSLFIKSKKKELNYFKLFTAVSFFFFLLAASATLPNARYVHPIIPLIMILAGIGLVKLAESLPSKLQKLVLVVMVLFILFPTFKHFTFDARSRTQQFNVDKPIAGKKIAGVMAENIPKGQLTITNLDAWAAWYYDLTTMWFPVEVDMLEGYQDKVDYIVITNYKEHDGDFALGEWEEVVYKPEDIQNQFLRQNYQILKKFEITPESNYENKQFIGTILKKK